VSGVGVEVRDLHKTFRPAGTALGRSPPVPAVRGVSFALEPGEFAALVGESGSGKTTLGRCLVGLTRFERGGVRVGGYDPARLGWGRRAEFARTAQMVFQNPYATLNPAFRVRFLLAEAVRIHRRLPRSAVRAEVERLAETVHLPPERLDAFPPELSGGERRRVAFARALATRPRFVVADEPVAGLDPPIQEQLVALLRRIHRRRGLTVLLVTHDLRVVRTLVDRVLVLFRGRLVEDAPARVFFGGGALHPYSRELLTSAFGVAEAVAGPTRPFSEPPLTGCPFSSRCAEALAEPDGPCARMPPTLRAVGSAHRVACHRRTSGSENPR